METRRTRRADRSGRVPSDTKYRVIADGNPIKGIPVEVWYHVVRYQVPRYSGWKQDYMLRKT